MAFALFALCFYLVQRKVVKKLTDCSVLLESSMFLLKSDRLTACSENPSNASLVSGGLVNGNTYPVFITMYLGVLKWVQCLFMVSCVESLRTGNLIFQSKLQQVSEL